MPFQIIRNDITKVKADAIVNTANPLPKYAGGTDKAIYEAAGKEDLLAERKKIGNINPGEVAVTPAFNLKAKYILHTVGPTWDGGKKGEFEILRNCYKKCLEKAYELKCETIAFPLIATGVYEFPKDEALKIAMNEISDFLMKDDVDMTVKLVVFDDKAFRLSRNLFMQVESFITDNDVVQAYRQEYRMPERSCYYLGEDDIPVRETRKVLNTGSSFNEETFDRSQFISDEKEDLSFQKQLLKIMMDKDIENAVAYKRSNVTKGAFSKIMCGDTKKPQKKTVLGFCIGLGLNLEEAGELLASADMAFNPYNKRDNLVIQCIYHKQYDINEVNAMLYACGQPLLGN